MLPKMTLFVVAAIAGLNVFCQDESSKKENLHAVRAAPCEVIKVTDIPGYSAMNRYFSANLGESFILGSNGFGVYQAGGPDSYTWDTLKRCHGKYLFYYQPGLPQEPNLHGYDTAEIRMHSFTLLNQMGIFGLGKYGLLFDFGENNESRIVPAEDLGTWQITGGGNPYQIMIIKKDTIKLGFQTTPNNLQLFKINRLRIDRIDHSELFEIVPENPGGGQPAATQEMIIKHGTNLPIVLLGPKGQAVLQAIHFISKE